VVLSMVLGSTVCAIAERDRAPSRVMAVESRKCISIE
jgi:hypothetical protein